ncbi:Smr/MutS family protein [Mucilaginibacter ginkgonis]|uniref:Smr/MutS family protein n=1 Tax=Mucilaginibacter ginkgonis TaxID=2682091 RepID=A0A6I4HVJ0_9SPHI|nr:Smr/MutS family protein [Mucilaginibacter ginkgonis]QQL50367.1 Smr/MutS family protein [Mucilaginibacter ginkgonis]
MANWNLGDFVRFVDERREGYITRIFDNGMVGVTGDDDFEIPVPANKITTVHGHGTKSDDDFSDAGQRATPEVNFVTKGIYLALANDIKAASVMRFYLVNETSYQLLITLTTGAGDKQKGEFAGIIEPKSFKQIYSAQLADLQLWPAINLNVLFYTARVDDIPKPIIFNEKFKAKDLSGTKKSLPLVDKNGWLFRLDNEELIIDAEKLKESFYKPLEEKREVEKPQSEIDLHIEKLRDDHQFIAPDQILQIQLSHFNKTLEAAIVHNLPDVTFIHGTGNGILRHEIHKQLGKNQKVATFMDARKEKFGYGATRVWLK